MQTSGRGRGRRRVGSRCGTYRLPRCPRRRATHLLTCQSLYFGASKASRVSTCAPSTTSKAASQLAEKLESRIRHRTSSDTITPRAFCDTRHLSNTIQRGEERASEPCRQSLVLPIYTHTSRPECIRCTTYRESLYTKPKLPLI